jgi:hypothetical protein
VETPQFVQIELRNKTRVIPCKPQPTITKLKQSHFYRCQSSHHPDGMMRKLSQKLSSHRPEE